MVEALRDDGQTLCCLNEVFVGHASHQSARYLIDAGGGVERQSSSGVVVTTGTGATGWARSIHRACRSDLVLPGPEDAEVAGKKRSELVEGMGCRSTAGQEDQRLAIAPPIKDFEGNPRTRGDLEGPGIESGHARCGILAGGEDNEDEW